MSSESHNEQTGETGVRRDRSETAEVEGHIRYPRGDDDVTTKGEEGIRYPRSESADDGPEVEGHLVRPRTEEPGGDDDEWVGGRGEEGLRRD